MKAGFILVATALMALFACTNEDLSNAVSEQKGTPAMTEAYVSVIDTSGVVDAEKAQQVARLFNTKFLPSAGTKSTLEKEVAEVKLVQDDEGTGLFYIVNYAHNQGYVLVSATQDYEPVLAYSEEGNFSMDEAVHTGVSVWLNEQRENMRSVDNLPDSIRQNYRLKWMDYNVKQQPYPMTRADEDVMGMLAFALAEWEREGYTVYRLEDIENTEFMESLPQDIKENLRYAQDSAEPNYGGKAHVTFLLQRNYTERYYDVSPLLETQWQQKNGFNAFTPGNAPVGCVAVAVGQIMKYHEYPSTYDWDNMPNVVATETTARFLAEVGEKVGMEYDVNESSSNIDKALAGLKAYGYSSARKVDHDNSPVTAELAAGRPVYMRGYDSSGFLGFKKEGHAWVCDGTSQWDSGTEYAIHILERAYSEAEPIRMSFIYSRKVGRIYNAFYHMNWGWGGLCDGGYFYDEVNVKFDDGTNLNFAHGREDIISITPPSN